MPQGPSPSGRASPRPYRERPRTGPGGALGPCGRSSGRSPARSGAEDARRWPRAGARAAWRSSVRQGGCTRKAGGPRAGGGRSCRRELPGAIRCPWRPWSAPARRPVAPSPRRPVNPAPCAPSRGLAVTRERCRLARGRPPAHLELRREGGRVGPESLDLGLEPVDLRLEAPTAPAALASGGSSGHGPSPAGSRTNQEPLTRTSTLIRRTPARNVLGSSVGPAVAPGSGCDGVPFRVWSNAYNVRVPIERRRRPGR